MKLLGLVYTALCFFSAFVASKPTSRSRPVSSDGSKGNSRPISLIAPQSAKKESPPPSPAKEALSLPAQITSIPPTSGKNPALPPRQNDVSSKSDGRLKKVDSPAQPQQQTSSGTSQWAASLKPGSSRPKLRINTNVPPLSFRKPPPTPQTPSSPKVDLKSISEVRKNPGRPPNLVDTTSSFYNNDRPKPGQPPYKADLPIKTPGNTPSSSRPVTPSAGRPGSPTPGTPDSPTYAQAAMKADANEAARKNKIQGLLNSGEYKPQRPDADWTPPSPDRNSRKNGKGKAAYFPKPGAQTGQTVYHPNAASSGRIKTSPRQHQYSGESGSPRNDPGFLQYTNNRDPYDRSYVRADRFKGQNGVEKLGATAVYDAKSLPYHAANKLQKLNQDPQMTYAEAVKKPPQAPKGSGTRKPKSDAEKNRASALSGVLQTYDLTRKNYRGTGPLANPRDEFPRAANKAYGIDGKHLEGDERVATTNKAPVPDRESRAEGALTEATQRHAKILAKKQNEKNKKEGKPLQEPMEGTAVMDADSMLFDHGGGRWAPWDGPAKNFASQSSSASPVAVPAFPRPQIGAAPTSANQEANFNALQKDYDANFPSLPSSLMQMSSPPSPGMSKAEGKKHARPDNPDDPTDKRRRYRRDLEEVLRPILNRWLMERQAALDAEIYASPAYLRQEYVS